MRERQEFDQLYRQHYEPLYRFALQIVADEAECHDIVSAVFEDVWRSFDTIEASRAKGFLYTNVRNKCINHLRRQKCHNKYIKYVEHLSSRYTLDRHQMEHEETMRAVNRVIADMKSPTREILEACYLQEKKYKEVAQEMGISISTVKKHMVRALRLLREIKKSLKP